MTDAYQCPFGARPHSRLKAHADPYTVAEFGARQCGCGSRRWIVRVSPPLPMSVNCERCGKQNYSATAYERGREAGPRVRAVSGDRAPF